MTLRFRCGCGQINYERSDWFCHYKDEGLLTWLRMLIGTRPVVR